MYSHTSTPARTFASDMLAVPDATQRGVDGKLQMRPPTLPDSTLDIAFDYRQESKLISAFPRGGKVWEGLRARQGLQPSHFISADAMKRMGLSVPLNSEQEITWWSQIKTEQAKKVRCTVVPSITEGIDLAFGTSSDDNGSEAPGATYSQAASTEKAETEIDDTLNSSLLFRTKTACEIIRCAIREVVESDSSLTKPSLMERARVAAEVIRTPMDILFNKKGSSHALRL
ncbi:unnamed protein product [Clonostachys rhizophaga]|uniref:Uncharacterized protein n=1 Tax=Clonostachys rhizophaga TaxID=160324 RepID=A0A9N9VYS2_9HYPO|nr:unnamed protein product [Clonostachys rhizophaga]